MNDMSDMTPDLTNELTVFFKALVDVERLQIAGLLAHKPLSVEQMAAQLEMKPAAPASAAVMFGTRRRSNFATALCGKIVLPPGPV